MGRVEEVPEERRFAPAGVEPIGLPHDEHTAPLQPLSRVHAGAGGSEGPAAQQIRRQPVLFLEDTQLGQQPHRFVLSSEELIKRARDVLRVGVHKSDALDEENFVFSAPFIGPLNAEQFRHNLQTLDLETPFPDLSPCYHHFRVDPWEPNRVWFSLRPVATHLGEFKGSLPWAVQPSGKCIQEPPQTASLTFNDKGQVIGHTMGYVMDRTIGNTGGLGGAFGLLYAINSPLPVPEGRPWAPSIQLTLFNTGNKLVQAGLYVLDRVASLLLPGWAVPTKHARNNM